MANNEVAPRPYAVAEWSVVSPTGAEIDLEPVPFKAIDFPVYEVQAAPQPDRPVFITVEPIPEG